MTSFRNLHQPTSRTIEVDNKPFLFFGGTAYLSLLNNASYIDLFKQGIDLYGLNNGTSRHNNVQLGIYQDAEEDLALRFNFESSAILSSGYLAAQVAVKSLCEGKEVFYAPDSHPALWSGDNPNVVSPFETWAAELLMKINQSQQNDFVIISNTLDNLKPSLYDFSVFKAIDKNKRLLLILDDSHGIGVMKKHAVSVDVQNLRSEQIRVVVLASLAKGLGTDAGVVMGDSDAISLVKKHPIFMGASPASPAGLYALIHGGLIYEEAFDRLQQNVSLLADKLTGLNMSYSPNFPVFTSSSAAIYRHLVENGIVISSFPYPTSSSPLLNRVVVSSAHLPEDIFRIAVVLTTELY